MSGDRKIEKGKGDYSLVMRDPAYKRKDLKKFWGASDGISVYVNECMYGRAFNLKKIHGVGRYCYFKGSPDVTPMLMPMLVGGGFIAGAVSGAAMAIAAGDEDTY